MTARAKPSSDGHAPPTHAETLRASPCHPAPVLTIPASTGGDRPRHSSHFRSKPCRSRPCHACLAGPLQAIPEHADRASPCLPRTAIPVSAAQCIAYPCHACVAYPRPCPPNADAPGTSYPRLPRHPALRRDDPSSAFTRVAFPAAPSSAGHTLHRDASPSPAVPRLARPRRAITRPTKERAFLPSPSGAETGSPLSLAPRIPRLPSSSDTEVQTPPNRVAPAPEPPRASHRCS